MSELPIDIPYKAPSVEARVSETHVRFELTPNDNAALTFDLLVPKDWAYSREFGPVTEMLLQPQGLGFFMQSVERGAPMIGVTLIRCPFEIALDVFARESIAKEGWTIVACTWFPGPNGMLYDVTARRIVDDLELVRRTTMRIDQARIFAVNSLCARQHWDAVKESFWAAHVTFALVNGTRDETCEHWLIASVKQPDFKLAYPLSWSAEPVESVGNRRSGVHLRLVAGETLLAYCFVQAERREAGVQPTASKLLEEGAELMSRSGVTLTSELRPVPEPEDVRAGAVEGWLAGYRADAQLGTAEIQIRLGFIVRPTVTFTLALCAPKFEDDILVHLRALRAYEIARSSLQTTEV